MTRWSPFVRVPILGLVLPIVVVFGACLNSAETNIDRSVVVGRLRSPILGSGRYGLRFELEVEPCFDRHYAPVTLRVRTASGKPSPVDRKLLFRFGHPNSTSWRPYINGETYVSVVLAKGQTEVVVHPTLLLLQGGFDWFAPEVYEQGVLLPGTEHMRIRFDDLFPRQFPSSGWYHDTNVLVIDRDAWPQQSKESVTSRSREPSPPSPLPSQGDGRLPDLRWFARTFLFSQEENAPGEQGGWETSSAPWTLSTARDWYWYHAFRVETHLIELLPPEGLPVEWRWYARVTVAVIPYNELAYLVEYEEARFAALRQWVRMGGHLLVIGEGDSRSHQEIAEWLGASSSAKWSPVIATLEDKAFLDAWATFSESHSSDLPDRELSPTPEELAAFDGNALRKLPVAWGSVYLGERAKLEGSPWYWRALFVAPDASPRSLSTHCGGSFDNTHDLYWFRMIPGVGTRPIGAFMVLITVVAILIGPCNLWWASRKRLPLLTMVIAPVVSLVAVVLFVGVAFFGDGLKTRGRIRSVTLLDHEHSEALSWSHQAVFAPFRPEAFVVPYGAYVVPVMTDEDRREGRRKPITLERRGNREFFGGSMVATRRLKQAVVGHGTSTKARVAVVVHEEGQVEIANRLGCVITSLVLRTPDGRWHQVAHEVAPRKRKRLEQVSAKKARATLGEWKTRWPLEPSPVFEEYDRSYFFESFFSWRRPTRFITSGRLDVLMERPVERILRRGELQPGEFAAVVSKPEFVPIGVPADRWTPDLELVIGQWQSP